MPNSVRNGRIDLLRGVSILAVLLLHFSLSYDLVDSPLSRILPPSWLRRAVLNGNYGVTIFFVISGFLITSNILRRYNHLSAVDCRQFYAFRASRIMPPLLLALLVIVPLGLVGVPSFRNSDGGHTMAASFFVPATLSVLTFWHNVLMQSNGWFNYSLNIYWSLSVEEMFYLGFPLVCVLLRRQALVLALCSVFIVAGPVYRGMHANDELYFECGYLACFDAIAIGCVTALLYRRIQRSAWFGRPAQVFAVFLLIVTYLMGIDGHETWGFSVVALCAAVLIGGAFGHAPPCADGRLSNTVRWMGRHSYELYLFHIIVLAGIRNLVPKGTMSYEYKLPSLTLFMGASALLAAGVARHFSNPINLHLRHLALRLTRPLRRSSPAA